SGGSPPGETESPSRKGADGDSQEDALVHAPNGERVSLLSRKTDALMDRSGDPARPATASPAPRPGGPIWKEGLLQQPDPQRLQGPEGVRVFRLAGNAQHRQPRPDRAQALGQLPAAHVG